MNLILKCLSIQQVKSYMLRRAQISLTWLLKEGPEKLLGHLTHRATRESFAEGCDLGLNETGAGDSGLVTDTASCWKLLTFKGSRRKVFTNPLFQQFTFSDPANRI